MESAFPFFQIKMENEKMDGVELPPIANDSIHNVTINYDNFSLNVQYKKKIMTKTYVKWKIIQK